MTPILALLPRISPLDLIDRVLPELPERPLFVDRYAGQSRARRSFILEKLRENSDAFASEEDVRAMMSHYPREF